MTEPTPELCGGHYSRITRDMSNGQQRAGCSCGWRGRLTRPAGAEHSALTAEWADHAGSAS